MSAIELRDLELAWRTAESIRGQRELVVDVRGLRNLDEAARRLLERFSASGARIVGETPGKPAAPAKGRCLALLGYR